MTKTAAAPAASLQTLDRATLRLLGALCGPCAYGRADEEAGDLAARIDAARLHVFLQNQHDANGLPNG